MDNMRRNPPEQEEDPIDQPQRHTIPARLHSPAYKKMERIRARRGQSQSAYLEALILKDK